MKITLRINGEDKTFTNDFVQGRIFRNALELNKKLKENTEISVDLFDTLVEFVVITFGKQFTVDEFWDGVEAHKLQDEVMRVFNQVLSFGGLQVTEGNDQGK